MLGYLPGERSVFLEGSCSTHLPFILKLDLLAFAFQDSYVGVWSLSGALGLSSSLPYASPPSHPAPDPLASVYRSHALSATFLSLSLLPLFPPFA